MVQGSVWGRWRWRVKWGSTLAAAQGDHSQPSTCTKVTALLLVAIAFSFLVENTQCWQDTCHDPNYEQLTEKAETMCRGDWSFLLVLLRTANDVGTAQFGTISSLFKKQCLGYHVFLQCKSSPCVEQFPPTCWRLIFGCMLQNYRELDRGTCYFRSQILDLWDKYQPVMHQNAWIEKVLWASVCYRIVNKIETFVVSIQPASCNTVTLLPGISSHFVFRAFRFLVVSQH